VRDLDVMGAHLSVLIKKDRAKELRAEEWLFLFGPQNGAGGAPSIQAESYDKKQTHAEDAGTDGARRLFLGVIVRNSCSLPLSRLYRPAQALEQPKISQFILSSECKSHGLERFVQWG